MASEPEFPVEETGPAPTPEPTTAEPEEPPRPAAEPDVPPRAKAAFEAGKGSSNPEYDFELDLDLNGDPPEPGAQTRVGSGDAQVDASAVTLHGLPDFDLDDASRPLPEIPGYDLLCVLARGGMGVVYLAKSHDLKRLCALKLILAGVHASSDAIRRFLTEAGTAARLKHPGIVQVYRLGQYDGRPFLELEFLDGGSLAARMDGTPWEPQAAVALMIPVAEALAEAHRQGIVHRDIKPGNLLLDADNRPKICDFGLARIINQASGLTEPGQILGSPWYMAPEQASGNTRDVGPPADVHALGAVLYELITGRPPFKAASVLSTLELVKTSPPVSPRRLVPTVPKDLDTIVLHCLEKNPDARYGNAGALADDLSRFLRGESVHARPVGLLVRFGRWCYRNPLLAGLELSVAALLLVTTAIGWLLYLRDNLSSREERLLNARLQHQIETAQVALEDAQANDQALRATLRTLERSIYDDRVNRAQDAFEDGDLARFRYLLDLLAPPPDATVARGWEYDYLRRIGQGERPILLEPDGEVTHTALSPDGRTLAEIHRDGRIQLRDARSGKPLRTLRPPDGRFLPVGARIALCLAFSPDGRTLAAAGDGRGVVLWDVPTGALLGPLPGDPGVVLSLAFSPDGRTLALADDAGRVILQQVARDRAPLPLRSTTNGVLDLAFSPDGAQLALAARDGKVHLFDAHDGEPLRILNGHDGPVFALAYAPDGAKLVSGGRDGLIQIWNPANGEMIGTLAGHADPVRAVAFHPNGDRLASGGNDRAVTLWDLDSGQELLRIHGAGATVSLLAFRPDGQTLAGVDQEGVIRLWDAGPRL